MRSATCRARVRRGAETRLPRAESGWSALVERLAACRSATTDRRTDRGPAGALDPGQTARLASPRRRSPRGGATSTSSTTSRTRNSWRSRSPSAGCARQAIVDAGRSRRRSATASSRRTTTSQAPRTTVTPKRRTGHRGRSSVCVAIDQVTGIRKGAKAQCFRHRRRSCPTRRRSTDAQQSPAANSVVGGRARHRRARERTGRPAICWAGRRGTAGRTGGRAARERSRRSKPLGRSSGAVDRLPRHPGTARVGQDLHRRADDRCPRRGREARRGHRDQPQGRPANLHEVARRRTRRRRIGQKPRSRRRDTDHALRSRCKEQRRARAALADTRSTSPARRRGSGRARNSKRPSTSCSSTRRARCHSRTCSPSRPRRRCSCSSATRSNSTSRCRARIRPAPIGRRSRTSSAMTPPCRRSAAFSSSRRGGSTRTSARSRRGVLRRPARVAAPLKDLVAAGALIGTGLRWIPVVHAGNQRPSRPRRRRKWRGWWSGCSRRAPHGPTRPNAPRRSTRRHPRGRALQRAGGAPQNGAAGRARRHGRQVPGPGGAGRHLLDGDVRPTSPRGHGVPVQPQPPQRRDVTGALRVRGRRQPGPHPRSLPVAAPDAAGERSRAFARVCRTSTPRGPNLPGAPPKS